MEVENRRTATSNADALARWHPGLLTCFYCLLAVLLLGALSAWGVAAITVGRYGPETARAAASAGMAIFVTALWSSLRRCSTPALPGVQGLLMMTGYMTIGTGTFSLIIVIPAAMLAVLAIIGIALVSLFRRDVSCAPRRFRRLVAFYSRFRMYQ
jgi:hypothetical protein